MFKNKLEIKIRFRLFLLIFLLSIIPFFFVLYLSQRSVFGFLLNQNKEYYNSQLAQIVKIFEKKQIQYYNIVSDFRETDVFINLNHSYIKNESDEINILSSLEKIKEIKDKNNIFNKFFLENFGDLILLHLDDSSYFSGKERVDYISKNAFIFNVSKYKEQKYFEELNNKNADTIFAKLDEGVVIGNNFDNYYGFSYPVVNNGRLSKIIIVISNDNFWIELFSYIESIGNSHLFILDRNNNPIWKNGSSSIQDHLTNKNILLEPDIERIVNKLSTSKDKVLSKRYFGIIDYNNTTYMVFSDIALSTETKFILLVPFKNVINIVYQFLKTVIYASFFLVIAMILASILSSQLFAKPIEKKTGIIQDENIYFMNLAHEIKTPLTLISNYLDRYIENYGMSEELRIMKSNIDKIKNDMLNFLDIGKLERGQTYYNHNQTINFTDYLKQKIELFRITADKKKISILSDIEENIFIKCDPFAIDRIINNLLDNAIKYSNENCNIHIKLLSEHNYALFSIKDNGIGIEEKSIKHLFRPYHQVSDKKQIVSGTGLGLYIIKKIILSANGTIDVESKKGEGTKFIVRLPVASRLGISDNLTNLHTTDNLSNKESKIIETKREPNRSNILVVEDNIDLLNYLSSSLSTFYNIYSAKNGSDALQMIAQLPRLDLIISDVMMEQMNGLDFYENLSNIEAYRDIPFIFLSAITSLPDKLKGLEIGAIDYISKPFVIEELLAKIKSILNLQKLKSALNERDKYATLGMLLSGISHEIFNPLAGIYGPLENLEKLISQNDCQYKDKANIFFDNIFTNMKRIENIIKSLKVLYYNKDLKNENVDIRKIVDSILEIFRTKISDKNIEVITESDNEFVLFTSHSAISQIMVNLISNSIDAVSQNGIISIKLISTKVKKIIVEDNGCGIKKENIKNIFNAFYTSKEVGKGMGLGLYIVADLIVKLGWSIEVESKENSGTTFIITAEKL